MRRLGHVVDVIAPAGGPAARACTSAAAPGRWPATWPATRPGSAQRVVELDGALAELVAARLPADGLGIEVVVGDARAALPGAARGSLDLLVLDVFAGSRIPAHLTSVEFLRVGGRGARPGRGVRGQPGRRRAARLRPDPGRGGAPRLLPERRAGRGAGRAARAPVRQPGAGRRDRALPVADLARRVARGPVPGPGAGRGRARRFAGGAVAPTDRTAGPSPLPPPGFFGRPDRARCPSPGHRRRPDMALPSLSPDGGRRIPGRYGCSMQAGVRPAVRRPQCIHAGCPHQILWTFGRAISVMPTSCPGARPGTPARCSGWTRRTGRRGLLNAGLRTVSAGRRGPRCAQRRVRACCSRAAWARRSGTAPG